MIGVKVRQLRKLAGLSQLELAQKAEIGLATVSRIERDLGNPTRASLDAVARVLGLTLEHFMGESKSSRQEEFIRVNLLLEAFEELTTQLAGVTQAHADMKHRLELLLQVQGWSEELQEKVSNPSE